MKHSDKIPPYFDSQAEGPGCRQVWINGTWYDTPTILDLEKTFRAYPGGRGLAALMAKICWEWMSYWETDYCAIRPEGNGSTFQMAQHLVLLHDPEAYHSVPEDSWTEASDDWPDVSGYRIYTMSCGYTLWRYDGAEDFEYCPGCGAKITWGK